MSEFTKTARRNVAKALTGVDDVEFQQNSFNFEFGLGFQDVDGIETVEQRIEHRMNKVINEELERFCLTCETDKLYDEQRNSYYCPECDI